MLEVTRMVYIYILIMLTLISISEEFDRVNVRPSIRQSKLKEIR